MRVVCTVLSLALLSVLPAPARAATDDGATVAALDIAYQAAVKANDADAMARVLHPDFILVTGSGAVVTREELLKQARNRNVAWEIQDEDLGTQTVRLFGDTAVVTARLRLKYVTDGKAYDRRLWFSDTYVRTPQGWRYAFGQASLALPG